MGKRVGKAKEGGGEPPREGPRAYCKLLAGERVWDEHRRPVFLKAIMSRLPTNAGLTRAMRKYGGLPRVWPLLEKWATGLTTRDLGMVAHLLDLCCFEDDLERERWKRMNASLAELEARVAARAKGVKGAKG